MTCAAASRFTCDMMSPPSRPRKPLGCPNMRIRFSGAPGPPRTRSISACRSLSRCTAQVLEGRVLKEWTSNRKVGTIKPWLTSAGVKPQNASEKPNGRVFRASMPHGWKMLTSTTAKGRHDAYPVGPREAREVEAQRVAAPARIRRNRPDKPQRTR